MAILRLGSGGDEVTRLHAALHANLPGWTRYFMIDVFNSTTLAAVKLFQKQACIQIDGLVGPQTKSALGMSITGRPYTHRVRLHFRSLTLTNVPFTRILASTQLVFAQYGIKVDYASGESLGLSPADAAKFQTINGSCEWTITSGEYAELQRSGTSAPINDIIVYYVDQFSENINGCGGHLRARPACVVAKAGTRWCTAHEVCHVLLGSTFNPVHMAPTSNLMHSVDIQRSTPTLTAAQLTGIKASHLCRTI